MFRHFPPLGHPWWRVAALSAVLCFYAKPGVADPDKDKWNAAVRFCSTVFGTAGQLEQSGKLRQARDVLLSCAKAHCFARVRQQCVNRYKRIESDIPSVVLLVTSEDGEPRVDVQVSIDNELVTNHLDGRALPVDPGVHEFTFSTDGKIIVTQKIMIVQGQRNRPISIEMRADRPGKPTVLGLPGAAIDAKASLDKPATDRKAPEKREAEVPAPEHAAPEQVAPAQASTERTAPEQSLSDTPPLDLRVERGPGAIPYVVGTAGLIGVGGAGLLTYWGRKDNDRLASCKPNCSQASVDHIRRMYVAADVSFSVGVAALATSVIWFLASPPSKPQTQSRYRVDLQPTPSGGFAALSGSF